MVPLLHPHSAALQALQLPWQCYSCLGAAVQLTLIIFIFWDENVKAISRESYKFLLCNDQPCLYIEVRKGLRYIFVCIVLGFSSMHLQGAFIAIAGADGHGIAEVKIRIKC